MHGVPPVKTFANNYGLDDKRALFLSHYLGGKSKMEALRLSGFPSNGANSAIFNDFRVSAALHAELARRLTCDAAPAAYNLLMKVMKDEKMPAKLRVECAKDLLNRAGFDAKRGAGQVDPSAPGKDMSAMSTDELKSIVGRLESELFSRAKPVPVGESPDSRQQAIDMLG